MTIANVQASKYGSAVSNAVTVSWASTPTAGNLLIARAIGVVATDGGTIAGWTRVDFARYGTTTGYVSIFVKVAGAGEGNVTVTFTAATTARLVIEEWSNTDGWQSTPQDQFTHANSTSSVTSKSTGTTGTTTIADELAISVIGFGGAVTGISWSQSFTASFAQPTGSLLFAGAHKILSATGTVETTASWTTSRLAGAAIATFKGNAPSGGGDVAKINGTAIASISKIDGVSIASISKINGVSI
jgi:hypothetical protein